MGTQLVTGAAGFLGRYLTRALLAQGESVRAFDQHLPDDGDSRIEWRVGDIRDAEAVRLTCDGMEIVYHLAALIPKLQHRVLWR